MYDINFIDYRKGKQSVDTREHLSDNPVFATQTVTVIVRRVMLWGCVLGQNMQAVL